jgi:hypothetical protein
MTMPGVRVVTVDPASFGGAASMMKLPALARQIGPLDLALIGPGETAAVYSLCRLIAPQRMGFACGLSRAEGFLTQALPYDGRRAVPDLLLDLARKVLDWPTMPLHRVTPLPKIGDTEAWGQGLPLDLSQNLPEEIPAGWDDDLPEDWDALCADQADFDDMSGSLPFKLPVALSQDRYGVIHPGAGDDLQRWGKERFDLLVPMLTAMTGLYWHVVDEDSFDLMDLSALLAGAEVFVGCHSGPLQLAAAQGVPWVAIGGPTSAAWDPPWRDVPGMVVRTVLSCQPCTSADGKRPNRCDQDSACLSLVTLDMVCQAVCDVRDRVYGRETELGRRKI